MSTADQNNPMSHPNPMKGKKLSEEEKARRRELRKQRTVLREQRRAELEAATKRRVSIIEELIQNEDVDPNTRAQLVLVLKGEYREYPHIIY